MTMDVDAILSKYQGAERSALIPLLQEIQEACGFLSRDNVVKVAQLLKLPASKVYGVATFYNQFRFQAPGRYHVQVCRGTACHVKGSSPLLEALKRTLKVEPGQTTRDGLFSLEVVACIGACSLAPAICVNGEVHAAVTAEKLQKIVAAYRKEASDGKAN